MSPPSSPGTQANYNASFVVNGTSYSFDVRGEGGSYTGPVVANQSVESIPWAQTYSVVRHYAGLKPLQRQYRALVYTNDDMLNLALQVGQTGTLTTPRQGAVLAALDEIDPYGDFDRSDTNGQVSIQLYFTILQ